MIINELKKLCRRRFSDIAELEEEKTVFSNSQTNNSKPILTSSESHVDQSDPTSSSVSLVSQHSHINQIGSQVFLDSTPTTNLLQSNALISQQQKTDHLKNLIFTKKKRFMRGGTQIPTIQKLVQESDPQIIKAKNNTRISFVNIEQCKRTSHSQTDSYTNQLPKEPRKSLKKNAVVCRQTSFWQKNLYNKGNDRKIIEPVIFNHRPNNILSGTAPNLYEKVPGVRHKSMYHNDLLDQEAKFTLNTFSLLNTIKNDKNVNMDSTLLGKILKINVKTELPVRKTSRRLTLPNQLHFP